MVAANPYPRAYVPASFDPSDFARINPLFDELLDRPIASPGELERWLLDFSELSSVIDEYGSRRYIDKSCHTEDPDIERAFMHFVESIEPQCKPRVFALQKKFLDSPHRARLTDPKYAILTRQWQADVDVFRDANVPLETRQTKLVTDYDKLCGAMMVEFRGQTYTQQQIA
ncbi:MAG TPA: hypothetical protein PKB10_05365, partial [Tepidisphaeraceae bacterium]|nr:hypothetical protein [Tepidisphaeraceae bacterium]